MSYLEQFYPESRFGGFTDIDGTVLFYTRVQALLSSESTAVDFGCGRGAWRDDPVEVRRALRMLKGRAAKVIGLDADEAGRENTSIDEFRMIRAGEDRWPVEDLSVDLCVCDNVLEHLEKPEVFFREASRILKPGGCLCVRTPNVWSYVGIASRLIPNRYHAGVASKVQEGRKEEDVFKTWYRCNTAGTMRKMLHNHGFDGIVYGYEAEPSYLSFSKLAYFFGVLHQKLSLKSMKPALFAFARRCS